MRVHGYIPWQHQWKQFGCFWGIPASMCMKELSPVAEMIWKPLETWARNGRRKARRTEYTCYKYSDRAASMIEEFDALMLQYVYNPFDTMWPFALISCLACHRHVCRRPVDQCQCLFGKIDTATFVISSESMHASSWVKCTKWPMYILVRPWLVLGFSHHRCACPLRHTRFIWISFLGTPDLGHVLRIHAYTFFARQGEASTKHQT